MGNGRPIVPNRVRLRLELLFPFSLGRQIAPTGVRRLSAGPQRAAAGMSQPDILSTTNLTFPDRNWDPEWKCWLAVADFAATDWRARVNVDPPPDMDATLREIEGLLNDARNERQEMLAEIIAQHDDFVSYFDQLLMAGPATHPETALLVTIAVAVGQLVVVDLKAQFSRARPSQVCPSLLPPLPVPGHPAYPSGHALQSYLIAHLVALVRPEMEPSLLALAARITRNREIAGFHYPSDGKAGQQAAGTTFAIMRDLPGIQEVIASAKREWSTP